MNNYFKSTGILHYGTDKLIVEIDKDIGYYYKSLIPKYKNVLGQRYRPHITVVRSVKDQPNYDYWNKYEGEEVEFLYSSIIMSSPYYYWLDVLSVRLEEIREELGLPIDSFGREIPVGYRKFFHITIGNVK